MSKDQPTNPRKAETPKKRTNWAATICGGAHCKCMNLDGKCTNYHNGDHPCPLNQEPTGAVPTPDTNFVDFPNKPPIPQEAMQNKPTPKCSTCKGLLPQLRAGTGSIRSDGVEMWICPDCGGSGAGQTEGDAYFCAKCGWNDTHDEIDHSSQAVPTPNRELDELIGVAKILDVLWENSYYSMGKAAADRIKEEMIYYFGEDWTTTMYEVMALDGVSKPSMRPQTVRTWKELTKALPTDKKLPEPTTPDAKAPNEPIYDENLGRLATPSCKSESASSDITRESHEKRTAIAKLFDGYVIDHQLVKAVDAIESLLNEAKLDPFDFVEPCDPDCSPERHAYHQGQWDMATRMKAELEGGDK